jgi:hypothetical protein
MTNLNQQIKSFTDQGIIVRATNIATDLNNFSYAGASRTESELKTIASNMMLQLSKYHHINRAYAEKVYAVFIIDQPDGLPNAKGLTHIRGTVGQRPVVEIFKVSDNSWLKSISIKIADIMPE